MTDLLSMTFCISTKLNHKLLFSCLVNPTMQQINYYLLSDYYSYAPFNSQLTFSCTNWNNKIAYHFGYVFLWFIISNPILNFNLVRRCLYLVCEILFYFQPGEPPHTGTHGIAQSISSQCCYITVGGKKIQSCLEFPHLTTHFLFFFFYYFYQKQTHIATISCISVIQC